MLLQPGEPVIPEHRVGEIRMEQEIGAFRQFMTRRSGWRKGANGCRWLFLTGH